MRTIHKIRKYLTPFQWFEVISVIGFTIYFAAIDKTNPLWYIMISSISAICGIFCVVLCAAGKKSQYYWGFVNIIGYIVISWTAKYYGEVMLNALYFLPSQFVGLYFWGKKYNYDKNQVKSKKMSIPATIICLLVSALCIWLYQMLLTALGGRQTWLDSTSTTFSITANALMVLRYREQWLLWIVVNAVTVALWAADTDWIMTTMWSVYLINSFYGLFLWAKMNKSYNIENT
jgi:nicotinamide mononucleotide transporter